MKVKVLFDPDTSVKLVEKGVECSTVQWPDSARPQTISNDKLEFVEDNPIPAFLVRKGPRVVAPDLSAPPKVEWAPMSKVRGRSMVAGKLRELVKDPSAPVRAVLHEKDGTTSEKSFSSMDEFLDDYYNERVHEYLTMKSSPEETIINLDISRETSRNKRFEDLKKRRNPAAEQGEKIMTNVETEMKPPKAKKAPKVKVAKAPKADKAPKTAKVEKKLVTNPRYDGKKLNRVLQRNLPEGAKPIKDTSTHWGAYIYIARKPNVTFEQFANRAGYPVSSLTWLVDNNHVVLR